MTPSDVSKLLGGCMIVRPPVPYADFASKRSVFLAGSIEMDKAEPWQEHFIDMVSDLNLLVMNPRREKWDVNLKQEADNPQFAEQVNWELDALEAATFIVVYFDPNTKSPISLMELGLFADTGKILVCCPEGFWRKGNVDIVCQRNSIPQFDSLEDLIKGFRLRFDGVQ